MNINYSGSAQLIIYNTCIFIVRKNILIFVIYINLRNPLLSIRAYIKILNRLINYLFLRNS